MTNFPIHTPVRALVLLGLALTACDPESQSLGNDDPGDPALAAEVRWSTVRPDIAGLDLALAPDGSFYVLGQSGFHPQGDGGYFDHLWLGKHGPSGGLLWETFEPSGVESTLYPIAVTVDDASNVYIAIIDYSELEGAENHVRKLDPNGDELWRVTLPGRAFALTARPGGGVIVGGAQDSLAWVQSIDAAGSLGWSRTFGDGGMRYSEVTALAIGTHDDVVVGGRLGIDPASSRSVAWVTSVLLADGAERWTLTEEASGATDRIHDLGVTPEGHVLAAVQTDVQSVSRLAEDLDGSQPWEWVNDKNPGTRSLAVFPDGGFAVGDGVFLDPEDPAACSDGFSPCPVAMRATRLEVDRTVRWSLYREDCRSADVLVPTQDGGVLIVANCGTSGSSVGLGLFQLEP